MRTRTTVAALGAASLLLLTACGDDSSDEGTEAEEQSDSDQQDVFEAAELMDYAEETHEAEVDCDEDLESTTGAFVVCDIAGSGSDENFEYAMFTVNPENEFMMRELYGSHPEPEQVPEEVEADEI